MSTVETNVPFTRTLLPPVICEVEVVIVVSKGSALNRVVSQSKTIFENGSVNEDKIKRNKL